MQIQLSNIPLVPWRGCGGSLLPPRTFRHSYPPPQP